jgi:hypothetical protein
MPPAPSSTSAIANVAPITTLAERATHALRLAMHQVAVALSIRLPTRRPGSGVPWSRASPLNSMLKAFFATREAAEVRV